MKKRRHEKMTFAYYPGCSLATSARESNQSLLQACRAMGLELIELEDWNCCGSSSAHSLDSRMGLSLAARNLSLASSGSPLLVMCPGCFKNLITAQAKLNESAQLRALQERRWKGAIDPNLKIVSFLEVMHLLTRPGSAGAGTRLHPKKNLYGLRAACYYGCMNMFPPKLRRPAPLWNLMQETLGDMGALPVNWPAANRCCGTFLTAARPDVSTPLVDQIMAGAIKSGAECVITACAMCQLNLEIRCSLKEKIPVLHLSEVLAVALGAEDYGGWFKRHLIDPRPLLTKRGLIS